MNTNTCQGAERLAAAHVCSACFPDNLWSRHSAGFLNWEPNYPQRFPLFQNKRTPWLSPVKKQTHTHKMKQLHIINQNITQCFFSAVRWTQEVAVGLWIWLLLTFARLVSPTTSAPDVWQQKYISKFENTAQSFLTNDGANAFTNGLWNQMKQTVTDPSIGNWWKRVGWYEWATGPVVSRHFNAKYAPRTWGGWSEWICVRTKRQEVMSVSFGLRWMSVYILFCQTLDTWAVLLLLLLL